MLIQNYKKRNKNKVFKYKISDTLETRLKKERIRYFFVLMR